MDFFFYNSRDNFYKSKFGAIAAGESLRLCIVMPRSFGCRDAKLMLKKDGSKDYIPHNLFWAGMYDDTKEIWDITITIPEKGLYWYYFKYSSDFGDSYIKNIGHGKGAVALGDDWQLTVYSPKFKTPDWIKGGVIYQIFPDRFYNSGKEKKNVPSDRILRSDWGNEPEWKPNGEGKVLNNDYFCGDLKGIEEKLGYLSSLGVTCLYLNPIFEAHSNHRYNTANYLKIDSLLGTEADFKSLCKTAEKNDIRIILDGVFSHTGDDSIYFNKQGRYNYIGAYNSQTSPYYSWYKFNKWCDDYKSWWGFITLPEVREEDKDYQHFIAGKDGVIEKWISLGAYGWRLDVADELPDCFLDVVRKSVKKANPDALIIGEVWEDASNKESYGKRRRYLQGKQLDSVMNYPFAEAILDFAKYGDAESFMEKVMTIVENYPPEALHAAMNHIGTHDTERAITKIVGESCKNRDRAWQSKKHLNHKEYSLGIKLLKLASAIQFTLPGVACIYYGDEVGLQGYKDPFNRGCFPWGNENEDLLKHYTSLSSLRKSSSVFKDGDIHFISSTLSCVAYERTNENSRILVVANRNAHEISYVLPDGWFGAGELNGYKVVGNTVEIPAFSVALLK